MQIKSLRIVAYRNWCIDDRDYSQAALERLDKLKRYDRLMEGGCSQAVALAELGISRATLYRWQAACRDRGKAGLEPRSRAPKRRRQKEWSRQVEQQVKHLRKQYPTWGKRKITVLLRRDRGLEVSESTVGRIIKSLVARGHIKQAAYYYGQVKAKKPRQFNGHAKRWKKGMKSKRPGEMVQIDHMTVNNFPGESIKHFEAICPISKIVVAQVYRSASSRCAADFLEQVIKELPFKVKSIQVDGGSEFMKDFEALCKKLKIKLFVLPPRSPELNGCVERCNRTIKAEFYYTYDGECDLGSIRGYLADYLKVYNNIRPHQSLNDATPFEYYQHIIQVAA